VMDAQARPDLGMARLQFGFDRILQADQDDIHIWMRFEEPERGRHRNVHTVIAPHGINRDCNFHVRDHTLFSSRLRNALQSSTHSRSRGTLVAWLSVL